MSNSPLVVHTRISPNSTIRTAKIDSIIIHHMGSTALSIEACGAGFASPARKASAHYGVGTDGRIGQYVDESRRAWTSNSWRHDDRAVTMEVANDTRYPDWHVSDAALASTIDLCADICRRNGIPRLNYTGDLSGNLLMHKWLFNTECPGPYLSSKFRYIADEVNRRLGVEVPEAEKPEEVTPEVPEAAAPLAVGDVITLLPGTRYTTGKKVPDWVMKKTLYCRAINGSNVSFSILKTGGITGVTSVTNVRKAGQAVATPEKPEQAQTAFAVNDAVRLASGARYYDGKRIPDWVQKRTVYVREIYANGNVLFSIFLTGPVTGITTQNYLQKI